MKKRFFTILVLGIIFCTNLFGQSEIRTDCSGVDNEGFSLLSYNDVQLYVINYKDVHGRTSVRHTKAYYINSKTILFLDSFFSKKPDFFGFNIYLVAYSDRAARFQKSSSQALLYLAPVRDVKDSIADYSALKNFFVTLGSTNPFSEDSLNKGIPCFGRCDSAIMRWIRYSGNFESLNVKPGGVEGHDIFLLSDNFNTHKPNRERYDVNQRRQELGGKQTKGVFFKKETIIRLAQFIRKANHIYEFPMIGIYYSSYNRLDHKRRQAHKDQTVLGFVPMRYLNSGYYEPDICSYVNFYRNIGTLSATSFKSENHGELCPDDCPRNGYQ